MYTNNTAFDILNNEAATASGLLGAGLTLLRKMDFTKESYVGQALFSITIGLERLMKLVIIYDYRYDHNNKMPDNFFLKNIGHNLLKLNAYVLALSVKHNVDEKTLTGVSADPIYSNILKILSDFAQSTRYYNLDVLTSKNYRGTNPIKEWEEIVNKEIIRRHFNIRSQKVQDFVSYDLTKADNDEERMKWATVNNLSKLYYEGQFIEVKAKYSMYYVYNLIKSICDVANAPSLYLLPILSDHFRIFLNTDKNYILSRRTWDNYKI